MKYLRTFESHRQMNEEFVGSLIKKMKNMAKEKISLKFSEMFGSSKEADGVMDQYKKEVIAKQNEKMKALRAFAEYIKSSQESGEVDENKMGELKQNFDQSKENYDKQIKMSKEKFDVKLGEIMSEEKNKKIKNYITLKKIEMQQELLDRELGVIHDQVGISEDQLKNNGDLSNIIKDVQEAAKKNAAMEKEQREILKSKGEVSTEFDMEEAKRDPENYLWSDSPFSKGEVKLDKGDTVVYFSKSNAQNNDSYDGTSATVIELLDGEGDMKQVEIRTKGSEEKGFKIPMGKIISSEKLADKKSEDEEQKKEDQKEETPGINVETEVEGETGQNEEEVSTDGTVKPADGKTSKPMQ
jgi:hypothetical protein